MFALNAILFVLLGLQFPGIVDELREDVSLGALLGAAAAVAATVVGVRLLFLLLPGLGFGDSVRERLAIGWTGMRGAISLAAVLAVPLAVPERSELIFLTVITIVVTLVGQGLTLPIVLRALKVEGERTWSPDEAVARLEAAQAALDQIEELEEEGTDEEQVRRLRELYRARFRRCMVVLSGDGGAPEDLEEPRERYGDLRRALIGTERRTLYGLRGEGRLRPDVLRLIERDLDLEEARLRS